jgi:NAD(P)-dependent dehydrogenase (short-subunit alcohol dehydrogenase family)
MDLGVKDRLYIILGGSRGLGYEAASVLAGDGARLVLISRTQKEVEAAARNLESKHGAVATGFAADASKSGEVEEVIGAAVQRFGAPRGLLVTSGLTFRNGTVLEVSDADWEANFQDVLMGHVRACRAVLPHMITNGGGTIVTTAAYSARAAKSFLFPYAAQKAAIVNFTKNLAKTYGEKGVRSNCVCPGAFETVRVNARIDELKNSRKTDREEAAAYLMSDVFKMPVALQRPGKPHEAGELMAFLLSERAAYLNGAIVNIDGGTDF